MLTLFLFFMGVYRKIKKACIAGRIFKKTNRGYINLYSTNPPVCDIGKEERDLIIKYEKKLINLYSKYENYGILEKLVFRLASERS